MNEALQTLQGILSGSAAVTPRFPPNSRYHHLATTTYTFPDGRTVACLPRRFVPSPESLGLLQEHEVMQGDRLDLLAAKYLGDPELYWRICDANGALRPDELMEIGRRLRITMPQGIPGGTGV